MTKASAQTQIIWLEDRIRNLEERLNEVERLTKTTKPIATGKVSRQWGWTLIPKPLTDEAIRLLIGGSGEAYAWNIQLVRAVEKAHGIGEKE